MDTELLNKKLELQMSDKLELSQSDFNLMTHRIAGFIAQKANAIELDSRIFENYETDKRYLIDFITENLDRSLVNRDGKFTKRLKKLFNGTEYKSIYEDWFNQEGNNCISTIINDIYANSDTILDIVSQLLWDSGDFGDCNSCYWYTEGQHARNYIRLSMSDSPNHLAIREYNKVYNGTGRVWLYDVEGDFNSFLVYNPYGTLNRDTNSTIKKVKRFLSLLTSRDYEYKLYNRRNINYDVDYYLNGSDIYYISTNIDNIPDSIYMSLELTHDREDDSFVCDNCGYTYSEDDLYYEDGESYCEECYYELYTTCEYCGNTVWREDVTYIDGEGDFCPNCVTKRTKQCDSCYDYHLKSDITYIEGEGELCPICCDKLANKCYVCDEYHSKDDTVELDEFGKLYLLCPDCAKTTFICDKCGYKYSYNDGAIKISDKKYCLTCALNVLLSNNITL